MVRIKFIIMDENSRYVKKLANYIFVNYSHKFIIETYSSIDKIFDYINNNEYSDQDIYLMDKLVFLKLENVLKFNPIILSDNPNNNEIDKYISGKEIINKILDVYIERENIVNEIEFSNNDKKIIGFYSPIGGIGVTTLSFICSILYGKKDIETLFISFETNTFLDMIIDKKKNNTLSEYFYYLLTDKELLIEKLKKENLSKYKNTYYIYPFESVLDYDEITANEINLFLTILKKNTNFKRIIIDIPSVMDKKNFEILKEVDGVVLVNGRKPYDYYKTNNFKNDIDRLGKSDFINNKNSLLVINKYKSNSSSNFDDVDLNPFNLSMIKVPWYRSLLEKNNDRYNYNISGDFKSAMDIIIDKM
jgi:Trk K+ transport system NAD-binding subunit